jgi:hypothetical protein
MTYNQAVTEIETLLSSHKMIHEVRFASPTQWINFDSVPAFPVASYVINSGSINSGRELVYNIQFWFLDKSGVDGEFETEVTSNQHAIAYDIIASLRQDTRFVIDDQITWNAISEKFEDYLSGVELTINLSTIGAFGACDFPN